MVPRTAVLVLAFDLAIRVTLRSALAVGEARARVAAAMKASLTAAPTE